MDETRRESKAARRPAEQQRSVAFVSTGGTISSVGRDELDLIDYTATGVRLDAHGILSRVPALATIASVEPIRYDAIRSVDITPDDWRQLASLCRRLALGPSAPTGIVIGHGTATLEETAYFLDLVLDVDIPIVLVGSQRPIGALSSDAPLNLVQAVAVALSPEAAGRGVLVVLNGEIHAARDVTKSATASLGAFVSPDVGILGYIDGTKVVFHRRGERSLPSFDIPEELPRVDVTYSYAGADGTDIEAFLRAGARGIVVAGLAPGNPAGRQLEALERAARSGVVVAQSSRAGRGQVHLGKRLRAAGFIGAGNLNPQKTRVALMLALSASNDREEIAEMLARA